MDLGLSHLSPQVHKNQVINSEFQWNKRPFYSYNPGREKDSERRANRVQSNFQRLKGTHLQRTNSISYKPSDCFVNPTRQFNFIRSLQSGLPLSLLLYAFNLNTLNVWGIMGEFDTLLMHVFDKRFRPPTLGCFLWAFCEF